MSINLIPRVPEILISFGENALSGALALGAEIDLKQNIATAIQADLRAITGTSGTGPTDPPIPGTLGIYNASVTAVTTANRNYRTALKTARAFSGTAIDVLRPSLGRQWNNDWVEAGFTTGSLAIPAIPETLLIELRSYLGSHPTKVNEPLGVTFAGIQAQLNTIQQARQIADARLAARVQAKEARDDSFQQLRQRLTGLREELAQLLDPDDERWYQFGFSRPIDGRTPNKVPSLDLRLVAPGEVQATWKRAALATNYRVSWRVNVSGASVTEVGLFADLSANITGLPASTSVIIGVTARNSTGETAATEKAILT